MNIVIGIISYLPEDKDIREIRIKRLSSLLLQCNELFNLPIYIEAQNWREEDYEELFIYNTLTIHHNEKALGITGARKRLRRWFIESEYDYLIMLDDDCELIGTKDGAGDYIKQIEDHPGMTGLFKDTLLKLFAISKDLFKEYDFKDGEPTKGEVFEDKLFINTLKIKCPDKLFQFKRTKNLNEISDSAWDPNSTWYHGQYDKHEMGDRTRERLKNEK